MIVVTSQKILPLVVIKVFTSNTSITDNKHNSKYNSTTYCDGFFNAVVSLILCVIADYSRCSISGGCSSD